MEQNANDFLLQFQHEFYMDISGNLDVEEPGGPEQAEWTRMAAGWKSVDITGEEETDDTAYLDGGGVKTITVLGGMPTFSFTGDFDNANEIHKYLASVFMKYGRQRIIPFKWVMPAPEGYTEGWTFQGLATIHDLSPASGDAAAKSEISVSVSFNGKPYSAEPYKSGL